MRKYLFIIGIFFYCNTYSQVDSVQIKKGSILQLLYPINSDSSFKFIKIIKHEYDYSGSTKIFKKQNEYSYNDYGSLLPIENGYIIVDTFFEKKKKNVANCQILSENGTLIRSDIVINDLENAIQSEEIINTGKVFKKYNNIFEKYFDRYSELINKYNNEIFVFVIAYSFLIFLLSVFFRNSLLENEDKFQVEPEEIFATNNNFIWLHWIYITNYKLAEFFRIKYFNLNQIILISEDNDEKILKNLILDFNLKLNENKNKQYQFYSSDRTTKGGAKEWVLWEIANLNLLLTTSRMNIKSKVNNDEVEKLINKHALFQNNVGNLFNQIIELLGLLQKKYS